MKNKTITDEMLRQRWIEWGCDEKFVDQIIAKINREPLGFIPNLFATRHLLTYFDRDEYLEVVERYKNGYYEPDYGLEDCAKYSDEELLERIKELDNDPDGPYEFSLGDGRGMSKETMEKVIKIVLKRFEEEKKGK